MVLVGKVVVQGLGSMKPPVDHGILSNFPALLALLRKLTK